MITDLEKGDMLKDNDPRMPGRKLVIERFEQPDPAGPIIAVCRHMSRYPREFRIRTDRIFTDGKERRYGFNRAADD